MTRKDAEFAVALLRGINVGGKNKIPMRSLVSIFTAAGCTDVKTYIQSGNVLFRRYNLIGLPEEISSALHLASGFTVPVILRKAREMQDAAAKNPFLQRGLDPAQLHLMFLDRLPLADRIYSLDPQRSAPDEFAVVGKDIYLNLPLGAAKTKLTNAYFDAKLKVVGTQRNWRTVVALAALMNIQ